MSLFFFIFFFFFFNDTATTEIYTLSLHDALPIRRRRTQVGQGGQASCGGPVQGGQGRARAGRRAARRGRPASGRTLSRKYAGHYQTQERNLSSLATAGPSRTCPQLRGPPSSRAICCYTYSLFG